MADKKISQLPLTSAIGADDISLLVSDGTDYKFAFSTLLQFIANNLNVGAKVAFGTTLPSNSTGKNGDLFIKTDTGAFAQKVSGTWTVVYTIPSSTGITNGTILYGVGIPGSGTGSNGDTYINTGTGIFYKKTSGTWGQVFSMQTGPQGPQGTTGSNGSNGTNGLSVLNGTMTPSNTSTGVNGDFYINTTNYTLYGPKTGGIWGPAVSLVGVGLPSGGSTGQVLVKSSNDDLEADWGNIGVSFENLTGDVNDSPSLSAALDEKADLVAGKVPAAQLPSYVDDVLEVANYAALPATGETGKIYVTLDTNHEYRWSGSAYIEIVASPGSTDAVPEGTTNKYFTAARVLTSVLTGIGFSSATAVTATDSILAGFGKLQAQITSLANVIITKAISIQGADGGLGIFKNDGTKSTYFNYDGFKVIDGIDGTHNYTGFGKKKITMDYGAVHEINIPDRDGTIALLDDIIAGGGSVSGLTAKQILYGKSDGTIEQIADFYYNPSTKTLSSGAVNEDLTGYTIQCMGDSIVLGSNPGVNSTTRFTKLVANDLGLTEVNYGANGAHMVGTSTSEIPNKTTTMRYLLIGYGINDCHSSTTVSTFSTAYSAYIAAALSKGWSGSQIILISINGVGKAYNDNTKALSFNSAISDIAAANGCLFVDVYSPLIDVNNGGALFLSDDQLHPNVAGHKVTSYVVLNAINKTNFKFTDERLAVNGKLALTKLILKNPKLVSKGKILVMDDDGNIAFALNVPVQNMNGKYVLNGSIVHYGAPLPSDYDETKDFVFGPNARLLSSTGSVDKGFALLPFKGSDGSTEFRNYFGTFIFYVSGGTPGNQGTALIIQINKDVSFGRNINMGLTTDMDCGGFGIITLLDYQGTNGMNFKQTFSEGGFNWFVSEGVNYQAIRHLTLDKSGRLHLGRNNSDIASAKLAVSSTTEGFLTPRMTTTQRDAISSPAEGLEIYNLTTHKKNFYNGTAWEVITSA